MYRKIEGVPDFDGTSYREKENKYVMLIPVINEGNRIIQELKKAKEYGIYRICDIVICDGGSEDGSLEKALLKSLFVNALLVKIGSGRQGAQLRMGIYWAIQRGYKGIVTIDGNNKDGIEAVHYFIEKLEQGYDFIQGSRFIDGGKAVNTPMHRWLAVRLVHAPIISLTARFHFTDTTNNFRGYSIKYLKDRRVQPLRDIFMTYELLAYLSVRASQLGYKVCEIPVTRRYPKGKIPTKIHGVFNNFSLILILLRNMIGYYNPTS